MTRKKLTLADIARIAGVSPSTVSRALNDNQSIPLKTRERIKRIAQQHNYRVDRRARNFRLQRSQIVAAIFPFDETSDRQISDPFYLEMMGALTDALGDYEHDLLVSRALTSDETWYEDYVLSKRADGLIIIGRETNDKGLARLEQMQTNFVVWGPPLPNQMYVSVGADGFDGGIQAVRHFVSRGRKRIAFIGGDYKYTETIHRRDGYIRGLTDTGIDLDESLIEYTHFTQATARLATETLLGRNPDIDAIFVASDLMAIAVIDRLRAMGRRVPEDVAIIGYDDILLASYTNPALTTIRQPFQEGGILMVRKLFQLMEGSQPVTSVTLPVELIVRDSCGAN